MIALLLHCRKVFWNKVKAVTKRKQSFKLRRLPSLPTKRRSSLSRNMKQGDRDVSHRGKVGKATLQKYSEKEQPQDWYLVPDVHQQNFDNEYDETLVSFPEPHTRGIYENNENRELDGIVSSARGITDAAPKKAHDTSFYQNDQRPSVNKSFSQINYGNRANTTETNLPNGKKRAKSAWSKPSAYIMAQFNPHLNKEVVQVAQVRSSEVAVVTKL